MPAKAFRRSANIPSKSKSTANSHRVARAPAVVERKCRHVRDFLGRIHRAADGDAACAGTEGDLAIHATAELFHDDVHYIDGMAHVDEFELNMDMARGLGRRARLLARRESSWAALRFAAMVAALSEAPARWAVLARARAAAKRDHDSQFSDRRTAGRLSRQRSRHARCKSKAPIKAIVGPWNHSFPNDAEFGPQIEWRDQAVRWFDYWLKGRDTGVLNGSAGL